MTQAISTPTQIDSAGTTLIGNWWSAPRPGTPPVRATVVIAPAMATKARYYEPFAQWLAQQGFDVLTFDYRGYGASSTTRNLREVTATVMDWADDARAAVAAARQRNPGSPTLYLGHSLGGQFVALLRPADIDAALLISTGSGYWQRNTPRTRWLTPLLWTIVAPALVRTAGYFPGKRIGVVGDLPPQVTTQWARWCRRAGYITTESADVAELFRRATVPTDSIWFTDDEILGERSFTDFVGFLPSAATTLTRVTPAELGVDRIGHHGIFHTSHEANGWPRLLHNGLEQMLQQHVSHNPPR